MTSYEVMWRLFDSEFGSIATVSGSTTSYTISGLERDSVYSITVTAVTANAGSLTSTPALASTLMEGMVVCSLSSISKS